MADTVIFGLTTDLRQGNVLDLTWAQMDLTGETVWIPLDESKSG